MEKKLVYDIHDKPKFGALLVFAIQQLLAIMAATIAVPAIIGNGMSASAALFGAGVGTLVYQLFTKFRSPVFLGSSFAFIGSMSAAFAGAASLSLGYLGLIIGALFAGLVYVVIAIVVKLAPPPILRQSCGRHPAKRPSRAAESTTWYICAGSATDCLSSREKKGLPLSAPVLTAVPWLLKSRKPPLNGSFPCSAKKFEKVIIGL